MARKLHILKRRVVLMAAIGLLSGCGDSCRQYSDFTCDEIEAARYNVFFYYPDQREEYIGEAVTLTSCGSVARGFASSKNMSSASWGYVCCMIANGSSCYEKHR
jgi:hypothetical protein